MKIELFQPLAVHELGKRANQEDTVYPAAGAATAASRVFLVCDGMGGHEHGEVASGIVASVMGAELDSRLARVGVITDDDLEAALEAAYLRLDARAGDALTTRRMGTTLTALVMHNAGVTVAHIGDSRIFHLRPATVEVLYESRDHSLVMEMYAAGEMTREEMATSTRKNVITRAVTPGADNRTHPDIVHIADVRPGDWFVLCTDGVLENTTAADLLELVGRSGTDADKREALVARTAGNADNHSAYLLHVKDVVREVADGSLPDDEATSPYNMLTVERRLRGERPALQPTPQPEPAPMPVPQPAPQQQRVVVEDNTPKSTGISYLTLGLVCVAVALLSWALFSLLGGSDKATVPTEPVQPVAQPTKTADPLNYDPYDASPEQSLTPPRGQRATRRRPATRGRHSQHGHHARPSHRQCLRQRCRQGLQAGINRPTDN